VKRVREESEPREEGEKSGIERTDRRREGDRAVDRSGVTDVLNNVLHWFDEVLLHEDGASVVALVNEVTEDSRVVVRRDGPYNVSA
jgi:hypothetical protein